MVPGVQLDVRGWAGAARHRIASLRRVRAPQRDRVVFVKTVGAGSLDRYSQKLAPHVDAEVVETDIYQRNARLFNAALWSPESVRGLAHDAAFVRLLRGRDAVVHLPNHHLARYGNFLSTPYIVTVHDLIRYFDGRAATPFIHSPNIRDRVGLRLDWLGIARAAAVIAVSNTTKRDLVDQLGVEEDKVFVVYEGVDHGLFKPVQRRVFPGRYILFVGSEQPRKNLATLLRAFAALKSDGAFDDLKLVKVGAPGGPEAPFRERTLETIRALGLERDVVFAGRVSDEELVAYYSGAQCLVLPSLYEGFGLPPLEAMACGCPVVLSTAGALPEVAGDAAITVDPLDMGGLASAMRRLLEDEDRRAELRRRGLAHSRRFTWERAALETGAVYQAVKLRLREKPAPATPPESVRV